MLNRVVVTGMGCITPLGHDKETLFKNLLEGNHGFSEISLYSDERMKAKIVAEVKNFDPKQYMDRKLVKRLDRSVQFAVAASQKALEDSKLNIEGINSEKFGIIVGTGVGGISSYFDESKAYLKDGPNYVSPLCVPKFIPNMASGHLSMMYNALGVVNTCVTACAAGTHAIGDGFRLIKHGYQDIILAGGTDACINPVMHAGFVNMNAHTLSKSVDFASRPFDVNRDGFVLGEGSGFLVLESFDHAKRRGAKIYGEIIGYGNTADAYHMTSPHPNGDGAARCMRAAIKEAGINSKDIVYVNAHGTGTPINDAVETLAIHQVFDHDVLINSTKSMIGHLMGAGGAVEAIATLMSLNEKQLHPSIGIEEMDPACNMNIVNTKKQFNGQYAMSNSFGFGGHNGSLIFKIERN